MMKRRHVAVGTLVTLVAVMLFGTVGLSAYNDEITVTVAKKPTEPTVTNFNVNKPPNALDDKITVTPANVRVKSAKVDDALYDGASFLVKSDTVVAVIGRGGIGATYIIEGEYKGGAGGGGAGGVHRYIDEWWAKAKDRVFGEALVLEDKNGSGSESVRTDVDTDGPPPPSDLCVFAVGEGQNKKGTVKYWIYKPVAGVTYKGRIYTKAGLPQGAEENLTKDGQNEKTNVVEKGDLALGDYYVLIKKNGANFRKINFSVLWVAISFKMTAQDNVKGVVTPTGDNNKKDKYKNERIPPSYNCGPGIFKPGPCWGVLSVGEVHPTTFSEDITPERHGQGRWYLTKAKQPSKGAGRWAPGKKDFSNEDTPPGNDNGSATFNDDRAPQSDNSAGHIYNWDAPGLPVTIPGQNWTVGDICRIRANFTTFASYKGNRCSEVKKWHVKLSYEKTATGWIPNNDVGNDNTATSGSFILLSEKLGHPTIGGTVPNILDKSDWANATKIPLVFDGDNFVDLPSVVFKKGDTTKVMTIIDPYWTGRTKAFGLFIPKAVFDSMTNGTWTIELTNVGDTTKATKTITVQD